jgi:hypothetical protein
VTSWEVGDLVDLVLDISGVTTDGTTAVTATLYAPDGTTSAPTMAPNGPVETPRSSWLGQFTAALAGTYRPRYVITGTGAGVISPSGDPSLEIRVAPSPATAQLGRVYATTTDYANELEAAPPAGARRLLARASRRIDRALFTALYEVDDNGYATDAAVKQTIMRATCAQAEYMVTTGDTGGVGYTARYPKVQIGSLSVDRGAAAAAANAADPIAPAALEILAAGGIALGEVGYY